MGDVDDAGGGQRPGGQTLARILPCERSEGRSDQHRRRYDKCDRRRDGRRCNEQGDDDGGHRAHDHLDRVTGCAQQPEHLERGEQGEEAHDEPTGRERGIGAGPKAGSGIVHHGAVQLAYLVQGVGMLLAGHGLGVVGAPK